MQCRISGPMIYIQVMLMTSMDAKITDGRDTFFISRVINYLIHKTCSS